MFQNKISKLVALYVLSITTGIYASNLSLSPQQITKRLHLIPASKAIIQWERVFKSEQKLKKYRINTLNTEQKIQLKKYLLNHAIDSDQPTVAGV
ncbi:hypothetical protein [Sulfurimonas sp.]|uniref:hypothetical protein n=1 Tax=Sulfurimonas sp. TaxID=2022749 RepID=UPI002627FD75|nr:hypothetical protein [Sulfurimonas sp.]